MENNILRKIGGWAVFYKMIFGIDLDMSGVKIPDKVEGFDHMIIIAKGIRLDLIWKVFALRNILGNAWWMAKQEKFMQKAERGLVEKTYVIWVRDISDATDADNELNNLSAAQIDSLEIDTETFLEYSVHSLRLIVDEGKCLDGKSATLCASSRFSDGFVPRVGYRHVGGIGVHKCSVTASDPDVRARRVIRCA